MSQFPYKQVIMEDMAVRKQIYDFAGKTGSQIQLDQGYMNRNLDTMNERLYSSGIRLGAVLNSIFK
jgi:hypothetical protein